MEENIKKYYEKIKDQLSEEEFQAEIDSLRNEDPLKDDLTLINSVLKNHGVVNGNESQNEIDSINDDDITFTMTDDILEKYNTVKDLISQEDFLNRMKEFKQSESDNPFMNSSGFADMVVGELIDQEVEVVSEKPEHATDTIDKLEKGMQEITLSGRVNSISNPRSFKTRKGGSGKVCNVEIVDNTGSIRCVFWTQNIKLLKEVNEGDIIQINNVDIKDGYSGLEANLRPRSTLIHLKDIDESEFPAYKENITDIADIPPESKVNIIARIIKISTPRKYEKNGKEGRVVSLELQDATGKITYALWNKSVDLIKELELEDGDTVKILSAQSRERENMDGVKEISLSHWDGRIIKGDFEVPEYEQDFIAIGDASEQSDVSIKGIISRLHDVRTFLRKSDNSEGTLRNFEVMDSTGSIRVTIWGDDTSIPLEKGDIIKIIGGNIRFDRYTQSGYSMNTNFNTQITINPKNLTEKEIEEFDQLKKQLKPPLKIEAIKECDDEGEEVDVLGRILSVDDIREFQRDDGSVGILRSLVLVDNTGKIQLSLWDDKAKVEYSVGTPYLIENARIGLGMYEVGLNIGSGARIIKLSEKEALKSGIQELSVLEENLYEFKRIEDLYEDEEDKIIIARIIELNEVHKFERDDGSEGRVRNIEIADSTGSISVVLWDNDADLAMAIGDPIKLINPRLMLNADNRMEATVSRNTKIEDPSGSEMESLPSFDELKEVIYVPKTIESLLEDDTNVCVTGKINEVSTERVLLKKCPNCRANVEETAEESICDNCGNTFDEPDYILMIPTIIEDDTGEIHVTFFDKLAEELIDMEKTEIINAFDDGYGIEDKLEDLIGLTVEIIANVSFDEYNEENRLNPKQILSKYY